MEPRTRERKLFIIRGRPQKYPLTPQQGKFRQVLQECNITKGMPRDQLVDKMRNCIPKAWQKLKGANK